MNQIPRREFIKRSGALGAGLVTWPLAGSALAADDKASRPNFIVYMSDDHGLLFSEPYGNLEIHTPNLTQLAADGVRFTHAFNASPSCGPSRTAMLTALWPARNGAEPNHKPPKPGVEGLPGVLQALGYEVAVIGKVAHNDWAKLYNFDYVAGPNLGATGTIEVAKFLSSRDASKPLCLFFGSHFPHVPWVPNQGYDPATIKLPPTFVDTPETRGQLTQYYSSVSRTDALLGEYRALVKKHVPGDSLFLYAVDHGAQLPFAKWDLYDAGTRVPFIVSWPGKLKPGTTNDAMICLPDLLPTFIELAGGKVPDGLDGRSFAGLLRGSATTHRDQVFNTQSGDGDFNVYPSRSLRTRDWKYILNLHPEFQHQTHISDCTAPGGGKLYWQTWLAKAKTDPAAAAVVKRYTQRPAEELYDLNADPFEQHNLAGDPSQAGRLAALRAELKAWMRQQGDQEKVFGQPLLLGQPVIMYRPNGSKENLQNENI
jgi:N-sulfoglucosamine sulfohydrolase